MSSDFPEDSKRTQSLKIRIKIPTRKRSSSARNKVETERLKVEESCRNNESSSKTPENTLAVSKVQESSINSPPWAFVQFTHEKLQDFAEIIRQSHVSEEQVPKARAIMWHLLCEEIPFSLLRCSGLWEAVWDTAKQGNPQLSNRAVELLLYWSKSGCI